MNILPLLVISVFMSAFTKKIENSLKFKVGNVLFTSRIYKQMATSQSGNFLICPLSIQIILGLVQATTIGNSTKELSNVSAFPGHLNNFLNTFIKLLENLSDNYKCIKQVHNEIHLKPNITLRSLYEDMKIHVSDAGEDNSTSSDDKSKINFINTTALGDTRIKIAPINKFIFATMISIFINMISFQGEWNNQFDPILTEKKPFYKNATYFVKVDMMTMLYNFRYYESRLFKTKFLEIPFVENDITMTIILPNDVEGLSAIEKRISGLIDTNKLFYSDVMVTIPKFKYNNTISLVDVLKQLGMKQAFNSTSADLEYINSSENRLYVHEIFHTAKIEVNENGTTHNIERDDTRVLGYWPRKPFSRPTRIFNANHPFIYYLKCPNGILFIGRFTGQIDN